MRRPSPIVALLAAPALLVGACSDVEPGTAPPASAAVAAPAAGPRGTGPHMGGPQRGGPQMGGPQMGGPQRAGPRGPGQPGATWTDSSFLVEMVDHHYTAVRMGRLCPGRATRAELLALCASVVTTQSAEIDQMHQWLREWFGMRAAPTVTPRDERMLAALATLQGARFEIAWMEEMIPHHHMAIMMAQHVAARTGRAALARFARSIVTTQSAEVRVMQTWLCDWYGRCGMRRMPM